MRGERGDSREGHAGGVLSVSRSREFHFSPGCGSILGDDQQPRPGWEFGATGYHNGTKGHDSGGLI